FLSSLFHPAKSGVPMSLWLIFGLLKGIGSFLAVQKAVYKDTFYYFCELFIRILQPDAELHIQTRRF
ncbi:MAG: hypothetical protein ACPHGZ_04080, partial [Schleiferiaceae bacterium]